MQISVSSVGVQSKGSFIVFLVTKMSLFPASVLKQLTDFEVSSNYNASSFHLHTYLARVLEVVCRVCRLLKDYMSVGCVLVLGL